ncbi:unnamed protein product [Sphenostylis stenocarpa]|uniref:Uncharacterized protein n=1 Tax=Sphenostylis stenocarpa TaxID=92480 RepID=A0AA86RU55_9FABA|nr:unnamed protein product [Sphenostylis stenocarpa]
MATNSGTKEKKLEQLKEEEGEEEEIEALSLCDLPVNLINDEAQPKPKPDSQITETQEDFDFRLWGAPFSSESEMCAADEVFFQGQILPLRLSLKRCESSSESFDHGSGRKSSTWDFFRLGVAPAPEIALQDLKVRSTNGVNKNHIGRNTSSDNSSNSNLNANSAVKRSYSGKRNHFLKQFVIGGGLWSGCKCSIETVQSDMVMIKGGTKSANKTESATHAMTEKVMERKKQKQRPKQGKRTMSRRRTFEWIKELSHDPSYPDDEALLSKS